MAHSDEEQIEALKNWWKENGTSTLLAVVVVFVGFFGWRQWDASRSGNAAAASDLYRQLTALAGSAAEVSEDDRSTMSYLSEQLRSEFSSSIYAKFAALYMAQMYVEEDDLAAAEEQLSWILDNPGLGVMRDTDSTLYLAARARLARVIMARGEAERALEVLRQVDAEHYAATFAEIEGDAYLAMGDRSRAADAYVQASEAGSDSLLLELKMRDLGLR